MGKRINMRLTNLAEMDPEKAIEDESIFSGIFAVGSYYTKADRKEVKMDINAQMKWVDSKNSHLKPGKYMYAVGRLGGLYVDNVTVHSQFKAGKCVQSAGWLTYAGDWSSLIMDNNSGHYHPTLSQFLSTIYGLIKAKIIHEELKINLNPQTKIDYRVADAFWEDAIKNQNEISVNYDQLTDGLIFKIDDKTCQLTRDEILENGGFPDMPTQEIHQDRRSYKL